MKTIYPELTVDDFLQIDFGGGRKAELDQGTLLMMDGVTAWHSIVQGNILCFLHTSCRGTPYSAYGTGFASQTGPQSLRRPDVAVYSGYRPRERDEDRFGIDPHIVFELHAAGVARTDLLVKLDEYKGLPSMDTIVLVDVASERSRVLQRTGSNSWSDVTFAEPQGIELPLLNLCLPHSEIFARD